MRSFIFNSNTFFIFMMIFIGKLGYLNPKFTVYASLLILIVLEFYRAELYNNGKESYVNYCGLFFGNLVVSLSLVIYTTMYNEIELINYAIYAVLFEAFVTTIALLFFNFDFVIRRAELLNKNNNYSNYFDNFKKAMDKHKNDRLEKKNDEQ